MLNRLTLFLLAAATAMAAEFPEPYDTEPDKTGPMPAADAAARMMLPEGFKATVFAAEPDVRNPIAMAWDSRGRLWVAENYTYAEAELHFELKLRDRILIFEDSDGDGRFDRRKVFTDELQMLTSIEVGHGGVWAVCPPQVLFIPDRDRDDKPDGAGEVVLDGFKVPQESYHNFANGLRFGPDGWLYGRCGGTAPGDIGAPGTPPEQRVPVRGGVWRYHPARRSFETVTGGNTNPWGHDWNARGDLFNVNTVNGHLWHAFSGAHFMRGSTLDPNPRAYELIDMHADHWHYDRGKTWSDSRGGAANSFGGGHSHIGAMVYLGDNWPAEYHGNLYTLNQHGRRINREILEPSGSGYVARHGKDFMMAADSWFCGIDLSYGPDGGVFVLDWSDTGECHERNGVHRTSGRIFKITYGDPKPPGIGDLAALDDAALVALHTHANEWFSRQARLELAGRHAQGKDLGKAADALRKMVDQETDIQARLRALWTLHCIGGADMKYLLELTHGKDEPLRAWAVRLLGDGWPLDTLTSVRPDWRSEAAEAARQARASVERLAEMARTDESAPVRLALASTLQRVPADARIPIADGLVRHAGDAEDHNLPLLIWYGLIPVGDSHPAELARLGAACELPRTLRYIARRLTEDIEKNPRPLDDLLAHASPEQAPEVLTGMSEALTGWRKARKPGAWDAFCARMADSRDAEAPARIRELSVVFGDGRALDEVKKVALDDDADLKVRKAALQTLIDSRPPDLRKICERLLEVRFLNTLAVQGLAGFDDPAIAAELVATYKKFHQSERPQVLATLVSRPSFARVLLEAVGKGRIARQDLSAFHARQIRSFNDAELDATLARVWGELRESGADKQEMIAKLKQQLTPDTLAHADMGRGRAIYAAVCAACHRLYGEGNDVGPDLTGAGRDNIDYLLENIVDPSAQVSADFRMTVVNLKDGRVLNGFIIAQTGRTITLRTMTEKLAIERSEIAGMNELPVSLMPEQLLTALGESQSRDLIAYLMHKTQVPLPAAEGEGGK